MVTEINHTINICAIAATVPNSIVYNEALTYLSESEKKLLIRKAGINQRFISQNNKPSSFYAICSFNKIIENKGINKKKIKVLVYVTQTPDYIVPATSVYLQHVLGLDESTVCFDVNIGCSGYVQGLYLAQQLLLQYPEEYGILLTSDCSSRLIKSGDTATDTLFSDGASATLISIKEATKNKSFYNTFTDGKLYSTIFCAKQNTTGNGFLELDGIGIISFAIKSVIPNIRVLESKINEKGNFVSYYVFHQASKSINNLIYKKLNLDPKKILDSLGDYGNTSSASIPITLLHNKIKINQTNLENVLLCGFGVGMSYAAISLNLNNTEFYDIEKV